MVVIDDEDVEKDHDENFHSDLVDNCKDILLLPANRSTAAALHHNVTPFNPRSAFHSHSHHNSI